ncbi:MAG TPA: hypothetical protein VFC90_03885 [Planctomycetota bacterium]|nr:hypothetical protein [Planctomycetota bacterium]
MRRLAILIAVSIWGVSCDVGRIRADGRPVQEVWGTASPELRVAAASSPLRAEREVPLLSAPEVFAVYVPSHLDRARDLLIGEHWIYFRLRDGEWFIEREKEPELTAPEGATPADLRPLRSLEGMERMVTPWTEPKSP